jgi:hypothetical protein
MAGWSSFRIKTDIVNCQLITNLIMQLRDNLSNHVWISKKTATSSAEMKKSHPQILSYICISMNSSRSSKKQMETNHFSFIIHGWDGTHGCWHIRTHSKRYYRNNKNLENQLIYKLHKLIHIRLYKSQTFQDICVCVGGRVGQGHEPKCGYREETFSFNSIIA